jgi:hypothetical protein
MMNHINEHLGFAYRVQIEQQLGMSLPPQKDASGEDVPMDPQVEARLAPMLAQAAQQLLQQNQGQAAQQQAQQQQQDPLVQMQQQELQIKQQEQQRKAAKDQQDAQYNAQRLELDKARIIADAAKANKQQQNDMLKTAATLSADKQKSAIDNGLNVLKQLSAQQHQSGQQTGSHNHKLQTQQKDHAHQQDTTILNALRQQNLQPTKGNE